MGRLRHDAAGRRCGAGRSAGGAGRPGAWPADRAGGRRRPGAGPCRRRRVGRRQPRPDAPRPYPRHRRAGRSGRGAGPRQLRLREGVAGGAPHLGLRGGVALSGRGRVPGSPNRRRDGASARALTLRRADGWVPARHRSGRCRPGVRALRNVPVRRAAPRRGAPGAAVPTRAAAGGVPRRPARGPVPPLIRPRRAGVRPRPARPFHAPVLRRHAHRRAHHHALRRGRPGPGADGRAA